MKCPFYHNLCGKCRKSVCRGFFPEKQPYLTADMGAICTGGDHETECLIYPEAVKWREQRKRRRLAEHCPFASNAVCSQPWLWLCKALGTYFPIADVEKDEKGIVLRDGEGNPIYKPKQSVEDIRGTCLSGDPEKYEECPHYKDGLDLREYIKRVKKAEKP